MIESAAWIDHYLRPIPQNIFVIGNPKLDGICYCIYFSDQVKSIMEWPLLVEGIPNNACFG